MALLPLGLVAFFFPDGHLPFDSWITGGGTSGYDLTPLGDAGSHGKDRLRGNHLRLYVGSSHSF